MNNNGYLFYLAEDEAGMSDNCPTEDEAKESFETLFKRKPDRVIGITNVNGKSMSGAIVWENMDFLRL